MPDAEDNAGYDRTPCTHWVTITPNCDTRETVLRCDGTREKSAVEEMPDTDH